MVAQYLKEEYVGESRDANAIIKEVSPYISHIDCQHIKRIINQECPSHIDFEEDYKNKHMVLRKGNQQTFLQHQEVTAKAMNKEEKNSHVLPFRQWLVHFSPYCHAMPQEI
jgi:hypothetical protein